MKQWIRSLGIRLTWGRSWPWCRMPGLDPVPGSGVRRRATLSDGTYFGLARWGMSAKDAATLPSRTSMVTFENANCRSRNWKHLRRRHGNLDSAGIKHLRLRWCFDTIRIYHGHEGWITFPIAISSSRNGIRFWLSSTKRPNGSFPPRASECRKLVRDLAPEDPQPRAHGRKRELRRRPDVHHCGSLLMLAVTAGAFLLITRVATKGLFFLLKNPIP